MKKLRKIKINCVKKLTGFEYPMGLEPEQELELIGSLIDYLEHTLFSLRFTQNLPNIVGSYWF